jgi:NAD+ synthase (glutamine-hydrolysing)
MAIDSEFFNLYRHGFARVAVGVPVVQVADPAHNAAQTVLLLEEAAAHQSVLAVFPELGLSAYTCDDLFHQQALLDAVLHALGRVVEASSRLPVVTVIGVPLKVDHMLFNCAVVVYQGRILGVAPKTYLPNYREFYELRQFAPADAARSADIDLLGQRVPFGNRLLFQAENHPLFALYAEICEDLWVPVPPSSYAALAGATVMANLSASNITVGKDDYRRSLAASQSARCLSAYLYSAAGQGESTTDLAWDGHGLIYENGTRVAETERFQTAAHLVTGDIDLDRLSQDRMRQTTFSDSSRRHRDELAKFRTVTFNLELPTGAIPLARTYERFPYVPSDASRRDERCEEVYRVQVQGLATRLHSAGTGKIVIGISGGLDSTQALVVCAKAMDQMGLPRSNILAYTMPGFATSDRTLDQARRLMAAVGCAASEIDIRPSCLQMLKDIGHPFVAGKPEYDVTFENVQAGERTSHLFRLANQNAAIVVGTSDLSELSLGWCTYGVGDHMAHYHVNASVPKTLIQYLVRHVSRAKLLGAEASAVLDDVLDTAISPELVPGEANGQPVQASESVVGPYELQDFNLYYVLRFGYAPPKVAFLAWHAWHDSSRGNWPGIAAADRNAYPIGEIKRWLGVFVKRFFQLSQYKRSAIPNAPKVGSGGSLSPRADWRAPSDGESAAWLAQLDAIPDR